MCFRSMTSLPKRVGSWVLLVGIAAGLLTDARQTADAAKPQSSPFAGTYYHGLDPFSTITISDSGRISGKWYSFYGTSEYTVSGHVADDGLIRLKFSEKQLGKGYTVTTSSYVGMVALDEYGDLYGWLESEDGSVGLWWPRRH